MRLKTPRPYRDETDLDAMRALLMAGARAANGTYYVHPGDLNWWWYYHDPEGNFVGGTYLWEGEGRLRGWALIANGYIDVYPAPDLRGGPEAEGMYAWAEARMAEVQAEKAEIRMTYSWISSFDELLIEALERRGFTRQPEFHVHFTRGLEEIAPAAIATGYTVRGMRGEPDAAGRARASKAAFETKQDWEPYLANYIRFTQSPVYDPELDLVAVAPDGEIAAFAVAWLDPVNRTGLFEPVGTHLDHQRRGLGRAVLAEGMRRMKERGMERAAVCADHDNPAAQGLYAAAGFVVDDELRSYLKRIVRD